MHQESNVVEDKGSQQNPKPRRSIAKLVAECVGVVVGGFSIVSTILTGSRDARLLLELGIDVGIGYVAFLITRAVLSFVARTTLMGVVNAIIVVALMTGILIVSLVSFTVAFFLLFGEFVETGIGQVTFLILFLLVGLLSVGLVARFGSTGDENTDS